MTRPAPRFPSLRRQFAKAMILGVAVPALALIAGYGWYNTRQEKAAVAERTRSAVESAARDIDEYLALHRAAISVLAERRSEDGTLGDVSLWDADLRGLRRNFPGFLTMLVADADGTIVTSDPYLRRARPAPLGVADRSYFREPRRNGKPYISDSFRGRSLGQDPLIAVSAPLRDDNGFAGVVEGSVHADTIASARLQPLRVRRFEILLVDRVGHVIHASDGLPWRSLQKIHGAAAEKLLVPEDSRRMRLVRGVLRDGGDAYASSATLQTGWRLVLFVPKRLVDAEMRRAALVPLGLLVLITLGVIAVAWRQMRSLQGGIQRLLQTLQGFALGTSVHTPNALSMPTELQPLVSAIGELGHRLNAAYAELSGSLDEQRRLAASLQAVVATRESEIVERTAELRDAVSELDQISRTDALTGCLNYRAFQEVVPALWAQAAESGEPLSALALDIDHFKAYNDRYGHQEGDNALRRFAGAVRTALYHHGDILLRHGGEEFLVLLPGMGLEQALHVAERVRTSVHRAEILHEDAPQGLLTTSIGVATRESGDGPDAGAMLRRADEALYRAKHAGRDRVST